jgi:hypothetical protein
MRRGDFKVKKYDEMGRVWSGFCLCSAPPDTGETLHKLPRYGTSRRQHYAEGVFSPTSQQNLEDPLSPYARTRQYSQLNTNWIAPGTFIGSSRIAIFIVPLGLCTHTCFGKKIRVLHVHCSFTIQPFPTCETHSK